MDVQSATVRRACSEVAAELCWTVPRGPTVGPCPNVVQKSRRAKEIVVHSDKLKKYLGLTPNAWTGVGKPAAEAPTQEDRDSEAPTTGLESDNGATSAEVLPISADAPEGIESPREDQRAAKTAAQEDCDSEAPTTGFEGDNGVTLVEVAPSPADAPEGTTKSSRENQRATVSQLSPMAEAFRSRR